MQKQEKAIYGPGQPQQHRVQRGTAKAFVDICLSWWWYSVSPFLYSSLSLTLSSVSSLSLMLITTYASTHSFTFLFPNYHCAVLTCLLTGKKKEYWYFGFSSFIWIREHCECGLKASISKLICITFREGHVFHRCRFFICLI